MRWKPTLHSSVAENANTELGGSPFYSQFVGRHRSSLVGHRQSSFVSRRWSSVSHQLSSVVIIGGCRRWLSSVIDCRLCSSAVIVSGHRQLLSVVVGCHWLLSSVVVVSCYHRSLSSSAVVVSHLLSSSVVGRRRQWSSVVIVSGRHRSSSSAISCHQLSAVVICGHQPSSEPTTSRTKPDNCSSTWRRHFQRYNTSDPGCRRKCLAGSEAESWMSPVDRRHGKGAMGNQLTLMSPGCGGGSSLELS